MISSPGNLAAHSPAALNISTKTRQTSACSRLKLARPLAGFGYTAVLLPLRFAVRVAVGAAVWVAVGVIVIVGTEVGVVVGVGVKGKEGMEAKVCCLNTGGKEKNIEKQVSFGYYSQHLRFVKVQDSRTAEQVSSPAAQDGAIV
ncbi:hypothetical protein JW933_00920 [candidate division FCPU426 bacterium]|nr:hypothetical protein [candidate division FCPU426 bacterium]